jgi:hypothetical protein
MNGWRARHRLGSARASRAGFGTLAETNFVAEREGQSQEREKVRDGEGAITSTRGARAPQSRAQHF